MKVEHSLHAWANAGGIEPGALERQLVKTGYTPQPRKKIPFKIIRTALAGDKAAAEIRLKEAQAADQERKNRIADGETITLSAVLKLQADVLSPIRQFLLALPGTMAHLCNPTDPHHAQEQLERHIKQGLSMLRAEIGKVKE